MISKVIPDYAKNFKKEYLLFLRINDKTKYFIDNMKEVTFGLFNSPKVDELKKIIEEFYYEINIGNFKIKTSDIIDLVTFKKILNDLIRIFNYRRRCYQNFNCPFPGLENIYFDFDLFCSKFKIDYEDYDYLKCKGVFDFDDLDLEDFNSFV